MVEVDLWTFRMDSNNQPSSINVKFSDSGVKKLFILAIVADVQENYNNVSMLWQILKLSDLLKNIFG